MLTKYLQNNIVKVVKLRDMKISSMYKLVFLDNVSEIKEVDGHLVVNVDYTQEETVITRTGESTHVVDISKDITSGDGFSKHLNKILLY